MKNFLYPLICLVIILMSCGSSRNSIANTQEDIALLDAIKRLDKKPSDTSNQRNLFFLYDKATKVHLDNIATYNTLTEPDKWDKIIREYQVLQHISDVINGSKSAANLLHTENYTAKIELAKEDAAADYYNIGIDYLNNNDKQSSQDAYYAFKKARDFVPGYKDVDRQMNAAYQNAVVNVVINPVTDNSFYYNNAGWNNYGNSFNNDYLQRNLVRDLGGDYTKNATARYYTDWEARSANINPDLIVDLTWTNLDVPQPFTSQYSRNVSKQLAIGKDTSGNVKYETVSATLYITKKYFTATGDLESRITDAATRNAVDSRRYTSQFNWEHEFATYRGDSRALSGNDLALLNNRNFQVPSKQDILNELYERIYPQVKNGIYNTVRW
ncbi:MAG: hypothetical protein ABI683_02590 [Ginsengibacter sp.]